MKSLAIKKIVFVLFVFSSVAAYSQHTDSADVSANQQLNAINIYQSFVKPSTNLYAGPQYIEYAYSIPEGSPLLNADFVEGNLFYNGILYTNLPMQYDLMKELVIVKDPMNVYKFTLFNENVKWFTLANHKFERIINNDSGNTIMKTGFYDVLYDGKIGIYKKENLSIKETITYNAALRRYIAETDNYYIKKDNRFYEISNKNDLLSVLKDKRKDLQQYAKKNKLKFKKYKEYAFEKIAAYYDSLNK